MSTTPRAIYFARSAPYFAGLLALALVAFWPTYLSKLFDIATPYIHLHAVTATMWLLMLVVQPLAISAGRFRLHRIIGAASYVLAPCFIAIVVLLAHGRIQGVPEQAYPVAGYVLYVQLALATLFTLPYALGILTRRVVSLHARFMVCTALPMIDPVVVRFLLWWSATPTWNYQWLTFGLTDLVLVLLIWLERHRPAGRVVFPSMLAVFVLVQAPAVFGLIQVPMWQAFARWFAALPLT